MRRVKRKRATESRESLLRLARHAARCRAIPAAADGHDAVSGTGGTVLKIEVLHPPPVGPAGTENERSLVLSVTHAGRSILLTGDLEKAGTGFLLDQPRRPVDVLMAPHHGSRAALPRRLVEWAGPKLVVVCRGHTMGNTVTEKDAGPGVPVWDTDTAGSLTLRSHRTGLVAEAFRTGEKRVIPK
jgi:competence protein ComEC